MPVNKSINKRYVKGGTKQYPVGSLVFFFTRGCEIEPYGINHVGIVCKHDDKGPLIAHAVNKRPHAHFLVNHLREYDSNGYKMDYIIAYHPELNESKPNFVNALIPLINRLATTKAVQEPILRYSQKRSDDMHKIVDSLFAKTSTSTSREQTFINVISEHLRKSKESFIDEGELSAWFTILAKNLNLYKSKDNDKELFKHGVHCVQVVLFLYQVAFLSTFHNSYFYSLKALKKAFKREININAVRFSRKYKEDDMRYHPDIVFSSDFEKDLIRNALSEFLPLDGKITSPAALLMFLLDNESSFDGGIVKTPWSLNCSHDVSSPEFKRLQNHFQQQKKYLFEVSSDGDDKENLRRALDEIVLKKALDKIEEDSGVDKNIPNIEKKKKKKPTPPKVQSDIKKHRAQDFKKTISFLRQNQNGQRKGTGRNVARARPGR